MKIKTEAYESLSVIYDEVMKEIDYKLRSDYIMDIAGDHFKRKNLNVLELSAGIGKMARRISKKFSNYVLTDRSLKMLQQGRGLNLRKVCCDMTALPFNRKFDFIFSVHDTMNYFLEYENLKNVFRSVRRIMHKDSIFMFDITTEYNIRRYFNNRTEYNIRDIKIEWINEYDNTNKLVYSILKFNKHGSIETEKHIQRIYSVKEIKNLLLQEKFKILDIFSDYSFLPIKNDTVMINFITKMDDI